ELRSAPNPPGAGNPTQAGTGAADKGAVADPAAAPAAAAPGPTSASEAGAFRPESAGVITLFGKWFSLEGSRRQLADATKQTDGLSQDLEKIRGDVTAQARTLAGQNLDSASTDPAQLMQSKLQFQQAATRFRQLSTLLVPIGEQGITVENA